MLQRRYKHFHRYQEIVHTLARHGFGLLIRRQGGIVFLKRKIFGIKKEHKLSTAERIRLALEELGVTFIKIGQLLSTRSDLIPSEWVDELSKLQDQVPSFSFAEVKSQIQAELGCAPDDIFSSIETKPLAAASIGQVHRAVLHSGELVVIKVQRPGTEEIIKTDLEILSDLANLLEKHADWAKIYNLKEIVLEFEEMFADELNYVAEGRNIDIFHQNFSRDPKVHIPKLYWDYTTKRILTMEYVEAVKLIDEDAVSRMSVDMRDVVVDLSNAILKQVFVDGVFHGDLHPGNIMLLPEGRLVFLDFGSVGIIGEEMKKKFGKMLVAQISKDMVTIMRTFLSMGIAPQNINRRVLRRDIERIQHRYYGLPFNKINIGEAMQEFMSVAFKHNIRLPSEFTRLSRTLVILEGLIARLAPHTSLMELAEPFGKSLLRRGLSFKQFKKNIYKGVQELEEVLGSLPRQITDLINTLDKGNFKVMLEHKDLGKALNKVNHMVNRLAFSIVLASLIVGLSLIVRRADYLLIWRIPIAEIGFIVAGAMGFWLLISIIRSGRF